MPAFLCYISRAGVVLGQIVFQVGIKLGSQAGLPYTILNRLGPAYE